ncbi:ribonuclease H-like domain-containing protein, partial [Tanacetum coccineum]
RNLKRFLKLYKMTVRFKPCKKSCYNSSCNKYGFLVDLPQGMKVIGTKWVYRNKRDERGVVVRNKARLVAQGYTQEEGIDYDELPRAWYATLSTFLEKHGYKRSTIDKTLFIKRDKKDIMLVQMNSMDLQMYALTTYPTIYDSLVKRFWKTATANTLADGTLELQTTIDTIVYTITEASIRNKLQLADASGITMLPNNEIFEGMGHIGSKSGGWDQFGSNISTTALICLSSHWQIKHPDVAQSQPSTTALVPSTSPPPVQSPPPITTLIHASTPTPIPEIDPEPMEHTFEEPSPAH